MQVTTGPTHFQALLFGCIGTAQLPVGHGEEERTQLRAVWLREATPDDSTYVYLLYMGISVISEHILRDKWDAEGLHWSGYEARPQCHAEGK